MSGKTYRDQTVYDAAVERIRWTFDHFDRVVVSFSGGKDSTVLLHLTLAEAARRAYGPVDVLVVDLEGQYQVTIDHITEMLDRPDVRGWWICLPLNLRNAVSTFEPHWACWDPAERAHWVRPLPEHPTVISDPAVFPFYRFRMEFEEFVPAFQTWLAGDQQLACLVGIRADESLNRYRAIVRDRASREDGKPWTKRNDAQTCNVYPIYDWRTEDIWTYIGRTGNAYNKLYDYMWQNGLGIHDQRICQPYGDDQRKSLDQFHAIEPATWFRVVQRVSGANFGQLYKGQKILGYHGALDLPPGQTWESYTQLLLDTLPPKSQAHYLKKFEVFIRWWKTHGGWEGPIPDAGDRASEAAKKVPSWRRMALCILKNDFWCKSLSFSMTKDLYINYYLPFADEATPPTPADNLAALKRKYADL